MDCRSVVFIVCNAGLALGLFFLNILLGKVQYGYSGSLFKYGKFSFMGTEEMSFSGNFFQIIVNPAVYLAVVAAILQSYVSQEFLASLWMLVPFFWCWRLLYMFCKGVLSFLNRRYELAAFLLSLLLGEGVLYGIILPLAEQGEGVWLPVTALRDALWFSILAYLAKTAWDIMSRAFTGENLYPLQRRIRYVEKKYAAFQKKYGAHIQARAAFRCAKLGQAEREELIRTVYAVMIYENYNRPRLMRLAERFLKRTLFRHRIMSLGIMQVRTDRLITDLESIDLAMELLAAPFLSGDVNPVYEAVSRYNDGEDYPEEAMGILDMLEGGVG